METLHDLQNGGYDASEFYAEEASNFIPAPEGSHLARCIGIISLGTQKQEYQGKPSKDRKKVMVFWELPEEKHVFDESKGEEPFTISQIYSLVMGEKSNYKLQMEAWTGGRINSEFNLLSRLDEPCILTVSHKPSANDPTKIKAKVTAVSKLIKNQECPPRINPLRVLTFSKWDQQLFNEQSEWVQKTIEASPEYIKMKQGQPYAEGNKEGQWQKKSDKISPLNNNIR